jgi:hypothetical protein
MSPGSAAPGDLLARTFARDDCNGSKADADAYPIQRAYFFSPNPSRFALSPYTFARSFMYDSI